MISACKVPHGRFAKRHNSTISPLRLTVSEAERRFATDEITCEAILDALVDSAVLFKTADRVYGRLFPHAVAA